MSFPNCDFAYRFMLKELKLLNDVFFVSQPVYGNKHCLAYSNNKDSYVPKYYMIFKRDFFISFNIAFPKFIKSHPELSGYGESINVAALDLACKYNVDLLLFVHSDGRVYFINPIFLRSYVIKHSLVRKQFDNECTYSFPLKLLSPFELSVEKVVS